MSKYLERLAQSKEARSASENSLAEERAKLAVAQEINSVKGQLATNNAATDSAYRSTPFNVAKVLQLADEKKQLEQTLASLESIMSSEFGA